VATAAEVFRERGLNGIGVADLMKEVGLTHGGFYSHFPSRDALVAVAIDYAFDDAGHNLRSRIAKEKGSSFERLIKAYLSKWHRDHPQNGCPVAALAGDAARSGEQGKSAFTERFERYVEWVAGMLDGTVQERRTQAIATICAMAGAIAVSRALDDKRLSEEVIAAMLERCIDEN
jgi:TetR/AcrR family transcriptional repressor of nem operon